MSDLRGRINSLREEVTKEGRKNPEKLQADILLKLCRKLDKLITEYISTVGFAD